MDIKVTVDDIVRSELSALSIDVDKEIQQGIQLGLSDGGVHGFDRAKSIEADNSAKQKP
jgi:hypothetical protein